MAEKDSHPIVERGRGVLARLEALEELAEEFQQPVIRAKAAMNQLTLMVTGANPLLLSIRAVDALNDPLSALEDAIPVIEGTATTATIADFNSAVEDILYRLSDLLVIERPEDVEPLRTAINDITTFAHEQTNAVATEISTLSGLLGDVGTSIEEAKTANETAVAALRESLSELTAAVQVQKEELQTALASQASLFDAEQQKRQALFTTKIDELLLEHKTIQANVIDKGDASIRDVLLRGEEFLAKIEQRKQEVDRTAEAVGLTATISGFTEYADQQKKSADWWRRGAVVALVAIVALGLGTLIWVNQESLTLQRSLLKGSVGTALAILAGYAGKQSGHHRREERRSRRLGLEIAAFDPYVANLDSDRREALKEFMTLRVFGHLEDPDTEQDKWGEHQPSVQKVMDLLRRDEPDA